ncbi:MAG: sporulation protein [Rhodobacter sp.]|nr:sporulation protein [Rhodobacter sp.]
MAQAALRRFAFSLATTGLLMGCVEGAGSGTETDGGTAPALSAASRTGTGRDVEAPVVFQTTDTALWDGRPSLGGIWVASPDVTDPERVVMVNLANGKSVTGALFRRERDNPGPTLQMSSDAAEALGMLAGQPTEIRVTALRREEPEAPVETEVAAAVAAKPEAATEDTAAEADAAAVATAATAALGVADSAGATPGAEADPSATVAPAAGAAATEEPPKPKTWKERRAEAKAAREAKKAAAAAAAAGDGAEPATADGIAVDAIETAPLDAGTAEATAPVEAEASDAAGTEPVATEAAPSERPKTRRQKRAEAEAAAKAAEAAAAEAPAIAPVATGRPIQVASFSKEENAERAIQALAKIGITAQPQKSETNGKVVWGVVALGDAAMLNSIRAAGFADAFFLK